MPDNKVNFNMTEDLGGGMKVSGSLGIDGMKANTGVTGNTSSLALSGAFGTITGTAGEESCNGIVGAAAGVDLEDIGVGLECVAAQSDSVAYAFPTIGGVTVKVMTLEATEGTGDGAKTNYVFADYANGPLAAGVNFTKTNGKSTRTRATLKYDLGVAKLGFGYSTGLVAPGAKNNQTVLGAQFPMGATTFSVGYAKVDTGAATNKTATGIGMDYALSKRTSVETRYTKGNASATNDRDISVKLLHTF